VTAGAHATLEVSAALERVGAALEGLIEAREAWDLGSVDREGGRIEATLRAGLLPGVAHVVLELRSATAAQTEVTAHLVTAPLFAGGAARQGLSALLRALEEQLEGS
jgi:hypothetical protein